MKRLLIFVTAMAVASLSACADPTSAASLAGNWVGSITCYNIDSPLKVAILAATPAKATVSMGDASALSWEASVAFDDAARTVTIKSDVPTGDAQTISGTLNSNGSSISGAMERQLCNRFKLTRQP